MRRFILIFLTLWCYNAWGQVTVSLRDTRYVQIGYEFKNKWSGQLEHSIYSEHLGNQRIRLMIGYKHSWTLFSFFVNPYVSTTWNGSYQDYGAQLSGKFRIVDIWCIDATFNPHYDTGIGYNTFYSVGTSLVLYKDVSLIAHYCDIPEYRISEKRVRVGFHFTVGNLWVSPVLSIPATGDAKTVRVLCSMGYRF